MAEYLNPNAQIVAWKKIAANIQANVIAEAQKHGVGICVWNDVEQRVLWLDPYELENNIEKELPNGSTTCRAIS